MAQLLNGVVGGESEWRGLQGGQAGLDYDKLDFDPEDGEEDAELLRLRALETQAKKLIPNYGSPPRRREITQPSPNLSLGVSYFQQKTYLVPAKAERQFVNDK